MAKKFPNMESLFDDANQGDQFRLVDDKLESMSQELFTEHDVPLDKARAMLRQAFIMALAIPVSATPKERTKLMKHLDTWMEGVVSFQRSAPPSVQALLKEMISAAMAAEDEAEGGTRH